MFYEAMLANGVDETKAKIMYFAVEKWGPHWDEQTIINSRLPPPVNLHDTKVAYKSDHDAYLFKDSGGGTVRLTGGVALEAWRTSSKGQYSDAPLAVVPSLAPTPRPDAAELARVSEIVKTQKLSLAQIDALAANSVLYSTPASRQPAELDRSPNREPNCPKTAYSWRRC